MATLGSQAVGSIVKLNVDGTAWNWIVVHQGLPGSMYDASCDGTWLLMQDIYEKRAWDSTNNDYANSDIHAYLNNTFLDLFDGGIANAIKQVKIPYTNGVGDTGISTTGSSGLAVKVFLISYAEINSGSFNFQTNGNILDYFDGKEQTDKIAYFNGTKTDWWTRTPYQNNTERAYYISSSGGSGSTSVTKTTVGVRPALIFPYELNVSDDGFVIAETGAITGSVNIGGVQRGLTGAGYINIGGVLRELSDSQINIGGILKSLKG